MAKLQDDEIKWILSLDASKTQQEIYKVTQANKELTSTNKDIKKAMLDLEGQGKKNSDTWNNLKASYDQNAESISKNNLLIKELVKTIGYEDMTKKQLAKTEKDLKDQLDNTVKSLHPEAYAKLEKEIEAVSVAKANLKTKTEVLTKSNAQLKAELGTLPGIFGEIQTKFLAGYQLIKNKTDEVIGTTKMLKQAINDKKVAVQLAKEADEAATAAELLLKKATAEGTATAEMATAAEKARAAATEASTVATSMGSAAMKIFKIALASTGIGLLIVALGALVTYFTATNEGAKKFKQITAGLSVYFQEFLSVAGRIGGVLFEAFSKPGGAITMLTGAIKLALLPLRTIFTLFNDIKQGNFGAALTHIKEAGIDGFKGLKDVVTGSFNTVKDLGGAISESGKIISKVNINTINSNAKLAMETEVSRQKLTKAEREWQSERIRIQGEIDVLEKKASKQSTLSSAEKLAAIKKAKEMRVSMFNTDLEYSKKNEDLVKKEQSFRSKKDYQAIQDAKNHTAQLVADKDSRIQGLQNKEGKANAAQLSSQASAYRKQQELQKKAAEQALKILEDDNLKKVNDIKKQYADGDIHSEFEYNQKLLKNQEEYDSKRKAKIEELLKTITNSTLRTELQKEIDEINGKSIDRQIEQNNKIKKILLSADPTKSESLSYDERLRELGLFGIKREDMTKEQLEVIKILEDQHNKTLKEINDKHDNDIIKSLKEVETSGQSALEVGENTKLLMLKKALSEKKITQTQFDLAEKQQAVESARAKLALAEANIKAIEAAEFKSPENKSTALKAAQLEIDKLKNTLTAAGIDLTNISKKTGKDISVEMTSIFGNTFSNLGSMFTSFYSTLDKLKNKDIKGWKGWSEAIGGIVENALAVATQANDAYYQMKASELEADKERELTAAGDNADARAKVEAEYAQKELDLKKEQSSADTKLKIAQAVTAGALAIIQAYAQLGPIGGTIAAGLIAGITAVQIATISKQNEAIQSTTLDASSSSSSSTSSGSYVTNADGFADGGYDPDGGYTGDGGRYEVAGHTNTGKPVHKGEYYVAQPEMANPVAAQLVRKLENIRQQRTSRNPLPAGFADGGYDPDGGTASSGGSNKSIHETIDKLSKSIDAFTKKPLQINYWSWKDAEKKVNDSYNLGSR